MDKELSFKEARRWYFIALDAYNSIRTMVPRELKNMYEDNLLVMFIDCYDLISYLFPKDTLIHEDHYDWINAIWKQIFETLHGNDNLKICVSPPSSLELFHFLERKAYYVYNSAPKITKEDEQNRALFQSKLMKNQYAYSLTDTLFDQASKDVPGLRKLKTLLNQRKMINACDVFDYHEPNWKDCVKVVSRKFESTGAEKFLQKRRAYYLRYKRGELPIDLDDLGLDSFSVKIDISNIAQTIFINSKSPHNFTFTSHGTYLILCCHRDSGYWKAKTEEAPVANALLGLYLAKSLRGFSSYEKASDFFLGAKFVFRNYLKEFSKNLTNNPGLRNFIYTPTKKLARNTWNKSHEFIMAENYLFEYCDNCFPGVLADFRDSFKIGPTKVKQYSDDEVLQFAKDEEFKKSRGEAMLDVSRNAMKNTGFFSPEKVLNGYYPPTEETTRLLLKLEGYRFSDWE